MCFQRRLTTGETGEKFRECMIWQGGDTPEEGASHLCQGFKRIWRRGKYVSQVEQGLDEASGLYSA